MFCPDVVVKLFVTGTGHRFQIKIQACIYRCEREIRCRDLTYFSLYSHSYLNNSKTASTGVKEGGKSLTT